MDYDKTVIANSYDSARTQSPEVRKIWEDRYVAHVPVGSVKEVLDLGCGTGRFSQTLADLYGARVVGVDPSETMLAQARTKAPSLTFLQGVGEGIPWADRAVDLVFISLVYHHLADPIQTAHECFRVLREGAAVIVRTPTTDANAYAAFDKFFPTYRQLAAQTMPDRATVTRVFTCAGLALTAHETLRQQSAPDWGEFRRKTSLRADSFLARLPDAEFRSGMAALDAFLSDGAGPTDPLMQPIDLFVFRRP